MSPQSELGHIAWLAFVFYGLPILVGPCPGIAVFVTTWVKRVDPCLIIIYWGTTWGRRSSPCLKLAP